MGVVAVDSLWSIDNLTTYCNDINGQNGSRTQRYMELLKIFETAIHQAGRKSVLQEIRLRYLAMKQSIPDDVTQKKCIKDFFQECRRLFKQKMKNLAAELREKQNTHAILSIDGGGIRGIIPATVLVEIEKMTNTPIADLFDLVGGTSTGGILTLGLNRPHPDGSGRPMYKAQDLLDIYTKEHSRIFRKVEPPRGDCPFSILNFPSYIQWNLYNPKYQSPVDLFEEKFGDYRLSSSLTDVIVTTNEIKAVLDRAGPHAFNPLVKTAGLLFTGSLYEDLYPNPMKKIHYFTNNKKKSFFRRVDYCLNKLEKDSSRHSYRGPTTYEHKLYGSLYTEGINPLAFLVAQATSAAPTYFSPIHLPLFESDFTDGGMLANNPSIVCLLDTMYKNIPKNNQFMLSLGTGSAAIPSPLDMFWFYSIQPDAQIQEIAKNMLPQNKYCRLDYHFKKKAPELDDCSNQSIQRLKDAGLELVETNTDNLRSICRIVKPDFA